MDSKNPLDPITQLVHDLATERAAALHWKTVATRRQENGVNGLPVWGKAVALVGLPGFIALYLLGAVPFLPSPIQRIQEQLAAAASTMHEHTKQTEGLLRATRQACKGVWRGNPEMQEECGR